MDKRIAWILVTMGFWVKIGLPSYLEWGLAGGLIAVAAVCFISLLCYLFLLPYVILFLAWLFSLDKRILWWILTVLVAGIVGGIIGLITNATGGLLAAAAVILVSLVVYFFLHFFVWIFVAYLECMVKMCDELDKENDFVPWQYP